MSRVAIVGCGLIGEKRAQAARAAGCEIVSVADIDQPRAALLAQRVGCPEVTTDFRQVSSAAPDIVVVATTHDRLASIALAMIEAGHHVLVEKPAGRTAAEVAPIVASARRKNVRVKVGFNHRFHPAMLKAREIVELGRARASALHPRTLRPRRPHRLREGVADAARKSRAAGS